ncbi:MAG: hypothetical protein ACYC7E_08820 [Armatimonadota bacterium]
MMKQNHNMKLLLSVALAAVAVVALVALSGCYGPAPGLNPVISFSTTGLTLNSISTGSAVNIDSTVTAGEGADIGGYQWSSEVLDTVTDLTWEDDSFFAAPGQPDTVWYAPSSLPVGASSLSMRLDLRVTTLQGGSNTESLNVTVVP